MSVWLVRSKSKAFHGEAARRFGVAASTVVGWLRRVAKTGSVAPGKIGGYKPRKIAGAHRDWRDCQEFRVRTVIMVKRNPTMSRRKIAIPNELLDQLLAGGAASAAFEQGGLKWTRGAGPLDTVSSLEADRS